MKQENKTEMLKRISEIEFNTPEMEAAFEKVEKENKRIIKSTKNDPIKMLTRFTI